MPLPLSAAELQTLKTIRNPFRGSVVGDPWKSGNDDADVARIHQSAFDSCCEAVETVRSSHGSAGIIINGEPGSGKTHLIGRLRRRLTDDLAHPTLERPRQAFAYVRLDTSASSLARHVRRKTADDLLRKVGGPNQFERMVITRLMEVAEGEGHLELWWEHFRDERLDETRELLAELCSREGLSPVFVEVLTHLVERRHRLDVASWLRGDPLTPAALERLGIAAEDADDHPERVAERYLVDMLKLAGSSMPLILCFDQVEALQTSPHDTESLFTFGQLISQLHAADQNLVLISCMQSSMYEQIRGSLPSHLLDRLGGFGTETLNPLTEELAELLIGHRLQSEEMVGIRPPGAANIWPFGSTDIQRFVGLTGSTPRRLLDQAAHQFDAIAKRIVERIELPSRDRMNEEWEDRLESATQKNDPKQSVEILRSGLQHLIHVTNSDWQTQSDPTGVLDFVLIEPRNEARVGVKVCDGSPQRLATQLRNLCRLYPGTLNLHKLVLLKDQRSPISRNAVVTLQHLKTLQVHDAVFHQVSPETFAALDAVRQLLADTKSGDLDFDGTTVPPRTVIEWLRSHLPSSLTDLADVLTIQSAGRDEWESSLVDKLQELLNERRIARIADLAESMEAKPEDLIAVASNRTDLFRVLDGAEAVVFSVRNGGLCLEESTR